MLEYVFLKSFLPSRNLLFSKWIITLFILFSTNLCFPNDDLSELDSLYKKINVLRNTDIDSVLFYSDLLNSLARTNNNKDYEYKSMIFKVKAYMKRGEHIEALNTCRQAKEFVLKNDLSKYALEVEFNTGQTFLAAGFASEALEIFLSVQNQKNKLNLQNQIDIDYYIGLAYIEIGDTEKGINSVKQSIVTDYEKNNLNNSFSSFILLASLSENVDSIRKFYGLADNIIIQNPDWNYQKVILLNNLAFFNDEMDNKSLSKSQYLETIRLSIESGLDEILSNVLNNYAYTLMDEQKYDSAKLVLNKALEIASQINSVDMLGTIYDTYSDYLSTIKNHELALIYMDSSVFYKNKYREQKRIKESIFISTMFETEQMEKELLLQDIKIIRLIVTVLASITILIVVIGLLILFRQRLRFARSKLDSIKRDRKLDVADALIKGQDNERKRIAMDLHDGLSAEIGTLGIKIDGFMSSHKKYPEIISSVHRIHKTVRELSHRMIPTQLERSGLVSAINNIVSSVNKTKEFSMEFETNLTVRLSERLEVNVYYLVNELVNNATKHSKGNSIYVQVIKHENLLSLLVEDNGDGFGSESENGIGLRNTKTRVEYLGGKFMMDTEGSETVFMIEIPI